jgi:alpha-glucosidase
MPWLSSLPHLGFSTAEPWLPVGESHRNLAIDRQEAKADSLLQFTRRCIELRKGHPALRHGSMQVVEAGDQRLVFDRCAGRDRIRCTFNLSDSPVAGTSGGTTIIEAGDVSDDTLGPWSAVIEVVA